MDLLQTNIVIADGELKKFGFIFGPLALAVSMWQASRGHWGYVYFFAPAGVYALVMALTKPRWIYPLRWFLEMVFKFFMWVVTHAVLILCFYLVFTPIGLVMRLMGKDLLHQDLDETVKSYWAVRDKQSFDPEHYKKQF